MTRAPYSSKQYRKALGSVLRSLRRHARMSQEAAAEAADMDRSYLSELENGQHDTVSFKVATLAAIYGTTFAEIAARIEAEAIKRAKH